MITSDAGRKAIMQREGVRLTAYRDSVGVLTIGVGHTASAGYPAPQPGMAITAGECDDILRRDLRKFETAVNAAIARPMTQNQFDAFVSLAFNIGGGAFASSSVAREFNAGNIAKAADAFRLWNKAGGRVLSGLVTRREAERRQFLTPDGLPSIAPPPAKPLAPTAPPALPPTAPGFWSRIGTALAGAFFKRRA